MNGGDHWLFIFNPAAGSGEDAAYLEAAFAALDHFEVVRSRRPGNVGRLLARALEAGHRRFVIAGGDGTINHAINAVAPNWDGIEFAFLPMGTGNDLARCLRLPTEPNQWVRTLTTESTRNLDVAEVSTADGSRFFVNASAGGFSTRVSENVNEQTKDRWGALAYALTAAKDLPELDPYAVTLSLEEGEIMEEEIYAVVVANGSHIAGGMPIAPDALPDDGLLDVILVPALETTALVSALTRLMIDREQTAEPFLHRRTRSLKIEAAPSFRVNADGEIVGGLPARYRMHPGALTVRVPAADGF